MKLEHPQGPELQNSSLPLISGVSAAITFPSMRLTPSLSSSAQLFPDTKLMRLRNHEVSVPYSKFAFPFYLSLSCVGGREENGTGNKQTVIIMEGPSCCRDQCGCASQLPGKSLSVGSGETLNTHCPLFLSLSGDGIMIPIELFLIFPRESGGIHISSQVKAEEKEAKKVKGKIFHPFNTFIYVSRPV